MDIFFHVHKKNMGSVGSDMHCVRETVFGICDEMEMMNERLRI